MISLARFRFSKSAGSAISRSSCAKRSRLRSTRELKSIGFCSRGADRGIRAGIDDPGYRSSLSFSRGAGANGLGPAITPRELLHASRGIDELLFPGEKRMACRTDADFDVLLGRARVIDSAASADDIGLVILRMNVRFHVWKRGANSSALWRSRKG